jgi:hypothetical protein
MIDDKPLFIVTGAGRSGTSAVARVLHESGLHMGRSMAAASEANPEGFYEDLEVVELNERILTGIGMNDPWRQERWPSRAQVLAAGAAHRDDMATLARTGVGGWKDPRFAITLEAWLPALPSKPKLIVCLRSPQAYADSSTRIYGLVKPARAMREWARHYRRLLAIIRRHKLKATCVEYDALIEQPEEVVSALSRFVDRPLDASYVVPRLRREFAPVPEAYRALYERVAELGAAPRATVSATVQASATRPRAATPDYARTVRSLIDRLVDAKAVWEAAAGMPAIARTDEVVTAYESYNVLLIDSQSKVAALVPPPDLERAHAKLVRRVNLERMIVELSFAAVSTGDERTHAAAVNAWRKFGLRSFDG